MTCAVWWSAWSIAARCFWVTSPAIEDGGEEPSQYVRYASAGDPSLWPAVTLAVSKRKGANAIEVADRVLARVNSLRGSLLPSDVHLSDHAQLRRDRRREIERAALAHAARRALGGGADLAGPRPARGRFVFSRDPGHARAHARHVLSLRLHAEPHHAVRADLLHRHPGGRRDRGGREHRAPCAPAATTSGRSLAQVAMRAVDEVGNPTILATLAVVAAILPMAFVGGLMGPYMRPIPVGRVGGDGVLAGRRLRGDAVGRRCGCSAAPPRHAAPRRRGPAHAALSPRDGSADRTHAAARCGFLARGRRPAPRRDRARPASAASR